MQSIPVGLRTAFHEADMTLTKAESYFLVHGSATVDKIQEIIMNAKYLPIFRTTLLEDKIAFIVVPYRNPEEFEVAVAQSIFYRELNIATAGFKENKKYLPEDHYANNRKEIEQLLNDHGDTIKTAVILGPGSCDDIPLISIVNHCAHVTLMEIDENTLQESIAELPAELQKKVEPKICDLNGILDYFTTRFFQVQSDLSAEEAQKLYYDIVKESMDFSNPPTADRKFDLVISSMVADQLYLQSTEFLIQALKTKIKNEELASFNPKAPWNFNWWITSNHFNHMKAMTNEWGIIFFSDQMFVRHTNYEGKDLVPEGEKKTCHGGWIKSFLIGLTPLSHKQWLWDMKLPMQNPETGLIEKGARMEVHAYAYKPWRESMRLDKDLREYRFHTLESAETFE